MDLTELEPLLNMSPYALMIVFGVWLVRWFQKEYWPHHKQKELNREALVVDAIKDIVDNNIDIMKKGVDSYVYQP